MLKKNREVMVCIAFGRGTKFLLDQILNQNVNRFESGETELFRLFPEFVARRFGDLKAHLGESLQQLAFP